MKTPGRKSRTDSRLAVVLVAVACAAAGPAYGGDGFLIPGVAFSEAVFEVGTWCRYLVVDEIMGASDSTVVYVAVTGSDVREGIESWWLELESGPVNAPPSRREVASALVSSGVRTLAPGDSLVQYVSELYVKKGAGPVERADPSDLEQLTLSNPTPDSDWELNPGQPVDTPHGRFVCDHKHLVVTDDREIDMGRVTLVRNNKDVFDVWLNADVPIFRVVKCVIERIRDSRTVPQVPGIPDKGREQSRTSVELIAFGKGAKSRIEIP